jgi:hypothetical protein
MQGRPFSASGSSGGNFELRLAALCRIVCWIALDWERGHSPDACHTSKILFARGRHRKVNTMGGFGLLFCSNVTEHALICESLHQLVRSCK